jgi:hypothetical protein
MNDPAKVTLRPAIGSDAAAIATVMRAALGSFDWMPIIHTPAEDLAFIRDIVLPRQQVTVAEAGEEIVGFIRRQRRLGGTALSRPDMDRARHRQPTADGRDRCPAGLEFQPALSLASSCSKCIASSARSAGTNRWS